MSTNIRIGVLAEKYETGKRGVGYISNGETWGDPGSTSYGPYQIETGKGTMQAYLKQDDIYTRQLVLYPINSSQFKTTWIRLAKQDPVGFQQSQFDFLCTKKGGYNDAYVWAVENGWSPEESFALQSAIYSTVNQSGGWKKGIFEKAGINYKDDEVTKINKLYDARARYFKSLVLTKAIKASILQNRTVDERRDCLKLVNKVVKPVEVAAQAVIPENPVQSTPTQNSLLNTLRTVWDLFKGNK